MVRWFQTHYKLLRDSAAYIVTRPLKAVALVVENGKGQSFTVSYRQSQPQHSDSVDTGDSHIQLQTVTVTA